MQNDTCTPPHYQFAASEKHVDESWLCVKQRNKMTLSCQVCFFRRDTVALKQFITF
jgi:hypothetical protein